MADSLPVLERFGDAAWRARVDPGVDPRALLDGLRAVAGVTDVVVCERHALVAFDPAHPPSLPEVTAALASGSAVRPNPRSESEHVVQVRYDGEDLGAIAAHTGLSVAEVVARHAAGRYRVAFIGFRPGFAYLRGLDARLVVPRRPSPRPRVPALSVAIAGPYAGVYPFASPGGWSLVGTAMGFAPFDSGTGAALALGDTVRFVPA